MRLLEALGVSWVTEGCEVLRPCDLSFETGECVVVLGPNGAGKTTLLRVLAGLLAPSSGEVRWEGRPYRELTRRQLARRIAYVPQIRPARIPLTVAQMVLLGRFPYLSAMQMAPAASDRAIVDEVLERAGLSHLGDRPMDVLSGGERQSVFIAAALAQEAKVLLLDEPTTHLDPKHQLEVSQLLRGLRGSAEHAIILTTHDLNLAARLADRVVALREGELVGQGAPEDLLGSDELQRIYQVPFEVLGEGASRRILPGLWE